MDGETLNTQRSGNVLVMGIGNLLLGDDGIGVHAVRKLRYELLPLHVTLLDVGTAFIDALSHVEGLKKLIILDAVKGGERPGTVYRVDVKPESHANYGASMHGMSVINMMQFAETALPESVCIIGIEPDVIHWSMKLSQTVEGAMPRLIDAVFSEIKH